MRFGTHGSPARLALFGAFVGATLIALAPTTRALTAPDLRSRVLVNGDAGDFEPDESIFGANAGFTSIEPDADSRWGPNEDLSRIRITWDRRHLYLAGEGRIWNNNMVLLVDLVPGQGLSDMTALNSWRRNITFSPDFAPDVFVATWDGYPSARLLLQVSGSQVDDQLSGALFVAVSSFHQDEAGRCVEARVPWETIFRYSTHGSVVVRDTVIAGEPDTLVFLPPGAKLRIAGAVTAGADGSGGPDVAPNNSVGCPDDFAAQLLIDNFAIVDLDADGDGLPDMGASPIQRVDFKDIALPARRTTWGRVKALYR